MGIFDFNKSSEKSLKTLFELDFDNSPNAEFYEQGEPTEFDGQTVRTFSKSFIEEYEFECGLFDVIDIKTFEGLPNKNFIFTNEAIAIGQEEIDLIQKLTNGIHSCYGKDDDGNKSFSQKDIEDIEFGYWHRNWSDRKNPAMLNYDSETGLALTIWITE